MRYLDIQVTSCTELRTNTVAKDCLWLFLSAAERKVSVKYLRDSLLSMPSSVPSPVRFPQVSAPEDIQCVRGGAASGLAGHLLDPADVVANVGMHAGIDSRRHSVCNW